MIDAKSEAAFPQHPDSSRYPSEQGMSLRNYFAAKAMQGICAHEDTWGIATNAGIAKSAYELADAMMVAREK